MRLLTICVLGMCLAACASIGILGRFEDGKYLAPNEKIAIVQYGAEPDQTVRDSYIATLDQGFYEQTDVFTLQGMYYASLTSVGMSAVSTPDQRRAALNKGLMNFVMPKIMLSVSENAEVVHQEFIVEDGKEMLLAIVRLPELSGATDLRRNRKFDAYPAILVLTEGGYVITLRVQSNLEDARPSSPQEKASGYLGWLRKLRSGLEVR